jgi:hypothetical protein
MSGYGQYGDFLTETNLISLSAGTRAAGRKAARTPEQMAKKYRSLLKRNRRI